MPPVTPVPQASFIFRFFGWFTYILSIIAFLVSLPCIIFAGAGLLGAVPLFYFIKIHRQYMRAIKINIALTPEQYKSYVSLAFLSGLASAFGFFNFWEISKGGLDEVTTPIAPFFYMAFIGAPIITVLIIFAASQWNARFNKPQPTQ